MAYILQTLQGEMSQVYYCIIIKVESFLYDNFSKKKYLNMQNVLYIMLTLLNLGEMYKHIQYSVDAITHLNWQMHDKCDIHGLIQVLIQVLIHTNSSMTVYVFYLMCLDKSSPSTVFNIQWAKTCETCSTPC